jgi:eukaryotic-like serine/threonine-protein kinase
MALAAGARLGPYEVLAPLGAGGMGEVYRARDTKLGRDVALKVLPESFIADPDRVGRFEREAKTLASLNHPNIGGIHGLQEASGVTALVLELVEGPTLADRIAQGPIPVDEVLPIAKQIADALEAAHEQGIIHRDLKPANIKVRPDGTVKVLDFGLAKAMEPAGASSGSVSISPTITSPVMTAAGVLLGTAAYMSPEQGRGRLVDRRADVWAFGCVLYEMLTGRRAFEGEDIAETLGAIIHKEPEWSALPIDTPPVVAGLLQRCLVKDPKRRLRDIGDARIEIETALHTPPTVDAARARSAPPVRSWGALAGWLVAAALALVCAVLTVFLARSASRPDTTDGVYRSLILAPQGDSNVAAPVRLGRGIALSPDGRRLAFVATGRDGRIVLWVRHLDALTAQPIAGTDGASSPFWSPDGRYVAFVADRKLKRVDASGGPVLSLSDGANPYSTGTWNRDDIILFAADGGILRMPAAGGQASPVISSDQIGSGYVGPFFLRDGRRFLYSATAPGGTLGRSIYVGAIDSNEQKKLRDGGSLPMYANGFLIFVQDDALMAQRFDPDRLELTGEAVPLTDEVQIGGGPAGSASYAVAGSGVLAYQRSVNPKSMLVWLDSNGKQLGILSEPKGFGYLQLSPHERSVVVSVREDTSRARDIWLYEIARAARTRLTDHPSDDFAAVSSPQADRLVFASSRGRGLNLYEKASTGLGGEKLLLDRDGNEIPTSWSGDGRFILFQTESPGADIWVLSLADSKVFPFATTRFGETSAQFSPDGRWIAYASDETGRQEVYVAPFQRPGAHVLISTDGGDAPRWGHDGKELFYIRRDNTLVAATVRSTATSIEVIAARPLFQTQFRSSIVPGSATMPYAVTSDGRFLVSRVVDDPTQPAITLVVNWPASVATKN